MWAGDNYDYKPTNLAKKKWNCKNVLQMSLTYFGPIVFIQQLCTSAFCWSCVWGHLININPLLNPLLGRPPTEGNIWLSRCSMLCYDYQLAATFAL